jgi:hypothetical protein
MEAVRDEQRGENENPAKPAEFSLHEAVAA